MRYDLANDHSLTLQPDGGIVSARPVTGASGPQGLPGVASAAHQADHAYTVGSIVQHTDGSWLRCTTNHTSGATIDLTKFEVVDTSASTVAGAAFSAAITAEAVPAAEAAAVPAAEAAAEAFLASDPGVAASAASAVSAELAAHGVLYASQAPTLDTNRAVDPQAKTYGGLWNNNTSSFTLTRLTGGTGLPAGITYGVESARTGTLSAIVAQLLLGSQTNNAGIWPVTPGETLTLGADLWTDQAACNGYVAYQFYNGSGVVGSTVFGTPTAIAQNTYETRALTGIVVPAGATFVALQGVVGKQSGNTVTGAKARMTKGFMVSGSSAPATYHDGSTIGWAWAGTPFVSSSKKVLLDTTDLAAYMTTAAGLAKSSVPVLASNRAVDPQGKAGGSVNAISTLTRLTGGTGLPAGITYGLEAVRGTVTGGSSVIGQMTLNNTSGALAWPVTAGETVTLAALVWCDQPTPQAYAEILWYSGAGAFLSASPASSSYSPLAQNTYEVRAITATAPASAAFAVIRSTFGTSSGAAVAGSKCRMTGGMLLSGAVAVTSYVGDGDTAGWVWTGTAHASASSKLFQSASDLSSTSQPVTITKNGEIFTIVSKLGTSTLAMTTSRNGSNNGGFNIVSTALDGVTVHANSDDVCPFRSQFGPLGGNHGYPNLAAFTNPDGKATADLGSKWTDGTRQYELLQIRSDGKLLLGGDYTTPGGVVTSPKVDPTVNLTHVSGATHTAAIVYTTKTTDQQLYPSLRRIQVTYLLDGVPVLTDGTYTGREVVVRETYEVLDYKSLYDTAGANVGTSYTALAVSACVRVHNTFRYTADGRDRVSTLIEELQPTTLGNTGGVQAFPPSKSGTTRKRYVPGVGTVSGFDWTAGVDLDAFASNVDIPNSAAPNGVPAFFLDVLESGGSPVMGWAVGYLPRGVRGDENSRSTLRATKAATILLQLLSTKKAYPFFTNAEAAGWGSVAGEAFRVYLTPAQVTAVLAAKDSAGGAWAALNAAKGLTPVA